MTVEKERRRLSAQLQDGGKGGAWGCDWPDSCGGDSREGGSDGSERSGTIGRSGPTWRYDTWPGPANCGSVGGWSPATTMVVENGAARKDGTLEWEVGKQPERTFPTSHSCVCDGRGAAWARDWVNGDLVWLFSVVGRLWEQAHEMKRKRERAARIKPARRRWQKRSGRCRAHGKGNGKGGAAGCDGLRCAVLQRHGRTSRMA